VKIMPTTNLRQLERRAYETLREKISTGVLQPGARLSEYAEAKALGTSRGPIREAVSKLASEGLVEKIPGIGVFVRTPADVDELREVFEFRAALETAAAELAATKITDQQLRELDETCAADAKVLQQLRRTKSKDLNDTQAASWIDADMTFHAIIAAAAGNRFVERHLHDVRFLGKVWGQRPDPQLYDVPNLLGDSLKQHQSIVAALRARDAGAARQAMSEHIRVTGEVFLSQMQRLGGSGQPWPYERLRALQRRA
jgi:DNA-binding GntR family transcriptional regulator